ncbi:MAG: NAD(P) transhydrogenase subunit alpha [Leptospiraceae bacterium]|nr:NAD(P) transhydrogenase subunit alpha [Leptospiraceae bacterium]
MEEILKFLVENKAMIYMLVLSIFVGIEIISKVPAVLHTPLMSGANAIHGVVIVGAIIVMGEAKESDILSLILGFIAVILGTLNVVGGFVVTDRMLEMFKKKTPAKKD